MTFSNHSGLGAKSSLAGDLVVETEKSTFKDVTVTMVWTGKYMSLFEKRDGKYVCIRDIYNDDKKE